MSRAVFARQLCVTTLTGTGLAMRQPGGIVTMGRKINFQSILLQNISVTFERGLKMHTLLRRKATVCVYKVQID